MYQANEQSDLNCTSKTTNLQLTLLPEDPLGDLAPAV